MSVFSASIPKKLFPNPSRSFTLFSMLVAVAICLFRPVSMQASGCPLNSPNGRVKHVIYIQFDNTHFLRDNPNVPSDLEQMPHLLNFLENNGTVLTNHHTPLISHTANDILTSLTGVYPDRHGVPVANSFRYFNPNGTSNPGVSFAYWTDPIFDPSTTTPTDTTFNMLAADGKNAPAPWVPYTRTRDATSAERGPLTWSLKTPPLISLPSSEPIRRKHRKFKAIRPRLLLTLLE